MYPINWEYEQALKYQWHQYKLTGMVGNKAFTEDDVSFLSITNRCSDDGEVSIGTVYTAEVKITFLKSLGVAWNQTKGWKLTLSEGLYISATQQYQYIPIGEYFIEEVNTTKEGIEVTAYDAMMKFDHARNMSSVGLKNRSLPAMLEDICETCGVSLANDSFVNFPNSVSAFSLAGENDCETFRDIISWIALTMGSFATINRDGELELKMYHPPLGAPDDIIDEDARADSYNFSHYITKYTGIYATYTKDKKTKYYHVTPDDGLTYNIGTNPFMQGLSEQRFKAVAEDILGALQNIAYMPFTIDTLPTAVYDLGDVIRFDGGDGNGRHGCIMLWDYTYNSSSTYEGLGKDPNQATAKSKTDKNLSGILSQTEANKEYLYSFSNDEDITLTPNWKTILVQRFGTASATWAVFQSEILCDAPDDAIVEVRYLMDNNVIQRYPIETWVKGNHILALMYPITTQEENFYTWAVQLKADKAVTIKTGDAIGIIKGQGLVSSDVWNGYIDIAESYEILQTTDDEDLINYAESSVVASTQIPETSSINESYAPITAEDDSEVQNYADAYAFNQDFLNKLTWDEASLHTWDYTEVNYVWGIDIE